MTMDLSEAYLAMQEASGIKVGDTVRVLRKSDDLEMGWGNVWDSPRMDNYIGQECEVIGIKGRSGVILDGWLFPFFVLEKIADAGIGIRRKITKELELKMNSDRAIEWALREGHTTRKGRIPGGLGLKLLREFVTLNKGRLQIVSDRGYWELNAEQETLTRMDHSFPGTVVNIEINTADTNSYRLSSESGNKHG